MEKTYLELEAERLRQRADAMRKELQGAIDALEDAEQEAEDAAFHAHWEACPRPYDQITQATLDMADRLAEDLFGIGARNA